MQRKLIETVDSACGTYPIVFGMGVKRYGRQAVGLVSRSYVKVNLFAKLNN